MYKHFFKISIAFLLALLSLVPGKASFNPIVNNKCIIHLDKSFYINGEMIWYKVYLPDIIRDRSVALKVVLTNSSGRIYNYSFLKTEGKTFAHGYYKIPFDIAPGVYHLFFVGMDDVNRLPVTLAEIPVPIYSDEQIPVSTEVVEIADPTEQSVVANELKVSVTLENDQVGKREEVRVRVKVTDASGKPAQANLSAAVTDWTLAGVPVLNQPTLQDGVIAFPGTFYNLAGSIYTRSRLLNESGQAIQANVLGAFSSKENKMFYTKTNAEGIIFLEFPDFYGSKPIQFVGYDNEYEHISVAPFNEVTVEKTESLVYTPGIIEYLTLSKQRKKIYQLYKSLEFSLNPEIPVQESQKLEGDVVMDIQQYERFPNLSVLFREILTPLRFRAISDTSFIARMYNPRMKRVDNYFPGKPLFIIDGKVTRNGDFIAKMSQDYIQRIDMIYEPAKLRSYFNVFGNNGVTIITTDLPEVNLPEEDEEDIVIVNGLLPIADFPYFDPKQMEAHRPLFRPQLYWNPSLQTNENGELTFSYFQSDDQSVFRIEIVAQGINSAIGSGRLVYEVKN